ncbi:MAG: YfhO family protein [Blastocatellia bacterium]
MKRISERQLVWLFMLLLPLVWFYPAVAGRVALVQGDGWPQHLGVKVLTGRMVAQGLLPLWNPYVFGGMPLLADVYPGAFYPLNWIFALLPPKAAINTVVIVTFYQALAGAYLFARAIGNRRVAALITGIVYSFGGMMVMSLGNSAMLAAAAWLPWVMLAIEKLCERAEWKWISAGALFIFLQFLTSFPQLTWQTALLGGAYVLYAVTLRKRSQPRWRMLAALGVMALCGALLSMIQLLPLRELQQQGARVTISYENFASHNFPLSQVAALIFPYFFGGASLPPYQQPYQGAWGIYVTAGYVGLAGLLLALVALFGVRRHTAWFWAFIAYVALLLSFGDSLPFGVNHLLYRIPVFNLFRTSSRHLFEFDFALAVLAGMGADWMMKAGQAVVQRTLKLCAAVLAGIVLLTATVYLSRGGGFRHAELLVPVLMLMLAVAAVWWLAKKQTLLSALIVVMVLCLDLASFGQFLDWRTLAFDVGGHLADPVTVKFIKDRERDANSFRLLSHAPNPFDNSYELLNHPNISIVRGLASVNGYDELRLSRPAAMMGGMSIDGRVTDPSAFDVRHQGFNLMNVRYLLTERADNSALPAERWRKLNVFYGVEVYENLKALPRAWFVGQTLTLNENEILRAIKDSRLPDGQVFNPTEIALVEEAVSLNATRTLQAEVSVTRSEPQRIELQTRSDQPGFLVLSEIYYPGWRARIDGQRTRIYRTDYTLRGLVVPAGAHRIELIYRPASFINGLTWASCGVLILLAGFVVVKLKERKLRNQGRHSAAVLPD